MLMFWPALGLASVIASHDFPTTSAQTAATSTGSTSFFPSQLNLSAPASPALDVLSLSASVIKPAANLQDLALGLVNSFDNAGHLKQGFAYAGTLSKLGLGPKLVNSQTYLNDIPSRLQWATNLSLAAVKGTSADDPSARVSGGISLPLIDDTDWRKHPEARAAYSLLAIKALGKHQKPSVAPDDGATELRNTLPKLTAAQIGAASLTGDEATLTRIRAEIKTAIDSTNSYLADTSVEGNRVKAVSDVMLVGNDWSTLDSIWDGPAFDQLKATFVKQQNAAYWNRRKFDISAAQTFFAANAGTDSLKSDGTYVWADYSDMLGPSGRFTLFGRYASHDRVFVAASKTWQVSNSRAFGANLRVGTDMYGFFVEYLASVLDNVGGSPTHNSVIQGGFEVSVGASQWLQVSFGNGSGTGVGKNVLNLNWNFNVSPTRELAPPSASKP